MASFVHCWRKSGGFGTDIEQATSADGPASRRLPVADTGTWLAEGKMSDLGFEMVDMGIVLGGYWFVACVDDSATFGSRCKMDSSPYSPSAAD